MKTLILTALAIALAAPKPISIILHPVPQPTCSPDDPNCTLDNGCNGGTCKVQ